jgi:hypothetical protein
VKSPDWFRRKADQEWELAGCARQDNDMKDAARHTERARAYERGEDPDQQKETA